MALPVEQLLMRVRDAASKNDLKTVESMALDRRPEVRLAALKALADGHYREFCRVAVQFLDDTDDKVRIFCRERLFMQVSTALPWLLYGLADRRRGPICAALLATHATGKQELLTRAESGMRLIAAAEALELPEELRAAAVTQLGRYPGELVDNCLVGLVDSTKGTLREAVLLALSRRPTRPAIEALLQAYIKGWPTDPVLIDWLSLQDDPRAIATLQRMLSWRGRLVIGPKLTVVAQRAMERVERRRKRVPDTGLSQARPPSPDPTDESLSRTDRS